PDARPTGRSCEPRRPEPRHQHQPGRDAGQGAGPPHAEAAPPAPPSLPSETRETEVPRRRSTVREPAPMNVGNEHAPPDHRAPAESTQPIVVSTDEDEAADRPRRSGWWSRRVLGKD